MQRIWKENFEDMYNIETQEQVAVHMCDFDGFGEVTASEENPLEELRLR